MPTKAEQNAQVAGKGGVQLTGSRAEGGGVSNTAARPRR